MSMGAGQGKQLRAFAPATVANVACGFDILGFALEGTGDEVVAEFSSTVGVEITAVHGDGGKLSCDPRKNTAGVSVLAFLDSLGGKQGFKLELFKKLPLNSGLGSSASSAAAALTAVNALLGCPRSAAQLVPFAMEAEQTACGSAHADNAAPALLGGFVLIRSYNPLDLVALACPPELCCVVVQPALEVRTEDARRILKQKIALKDAIIQWGNTAGLVAGLLKNDLGLIGRSLQDVIIEPERADLIPGFYAVKKAALDGGALGCSLSGSGPSMFALCVSAELGQELGRRMQAAFRGLAIASSFFVSRISARGAALRE